MAANLGFGVNTLILCVPTYSSGVAAASAAAGSLCDRQVAWPLAPVQPFQIAGFSGTASGRGRRHIVRSISVAKEREIIDGGILIGWVGGPVTDRNDPSKKRTQWYARPNPAAEGIRLPERTIWRETEEDALNALRDLVGDLRSTARIKRLHRD